MSNINEPSPAIPAGSKGVGLSEGGGVDDDPIITTAMIRAQDQARIEELEGLLRRSLPAVKVLSTMINVALPRSIGTEIAKELDADIEAALAKGKTT